MSKKTNLFYNILNILCIIFSCLCVLGVIFVTCMNGYPYESYLKMMKDITQDLGPGASFAVVCALPVLIFWFIINIFIFIFYVLPIISLICSAASSCYAIKHKTAKDIYIFSIITTIIMTLYFSIRFEGIQFTKYMGFNIAFFGLIVAIILLYYFKAIYEIIININNKTRGRK